MTIKPEAHKQFILDRRRFLQGMIAAGLVTWNAGLAKAATVLHPPTELKGNQFDLVIDTLPVNFTGKVRTAVAVNGSVPGPTLRWREGDTVTLSVTNRLKTFTSIHWHGMRIPSEMDGVPGLSFEGIGPGQKFTYEFTVKQNGTYWYHSHSGFQEQTGLSGAIIIDPLLSEAEAPEHDYAILLSDWTDLDPNSILSNLKGDSDYYNYHRPSLKQFSRDAHADGFSKALAQHMVWAKMNMSPSDIADVSGSAYSYLLNGAPPSSPWSAMFAPGQKVRLRFINGSAMTFFDVRIPGLKMMVVAADGNAIEPVTVDEFRIGTAETYDVIVEPKDEAYTIFAQAEDRTGFARAILTPKLGLLPDIPPMDPRPMRTMSDMGMKMTGMKMSANMDMPGMDMTSMEMPAMDKSSSGSMKGNQGSMSNMSVHSDTSISMGVGEAASVSSFESSFPLPQPGPGVLPIASAEGKQMMPADHPAKILHVGPEVATVASMTSSRPEDPGDGLQNNGRRVLTYADLRARYSGVDRRAPSREIELHLTGNMERFIWGFDGKKFSEAPPITLAYGERVRIILINDTMMEHPIHLHGLWSELENGHGEFNPYKHTLIVKPAERVSYVVTADTRGHWAYHCHLMYHMEAGMFRTVIVQ
ncbi:CopA family copper-resistance protein [Silvibacterium bohemicum]|uniref:CopA family copper-resistance protein n=1 Tax=Silvibacterium bohemicum TaxID=1577686 RepID=A0A841JSP9_9BACT|nr:copper resistance system multicopper oxidase [Silvibacterium bohemicum]MBB6144336.1 CopA family copper-resistance protein [Silvibacterium bohemicum]